MFDLSDAVKTYSDKEVLLVSDFSVDLIAKEILKSIELFNKFNTDGLFIYNDRYEASINESFGLDIENNDFHMILWENWMRFLAGLDLISIEFQWKCPFGLLFDENDILYLHNIIKQVGGIII
jgi:hypothetical protein